jgi:serine/threonine protein kinase/tetratricopeptide (TPR) repeat protein
MKQPISGRVRVRDFELDLRTGELCSLVDPANKVLLREQPFQVLRMLVERQGKLVSREEIRGNLWPNSTIVDFDHSINVAIGVLRKALGDSAGNPQYIETLARRGYRLLVPVEWLETTTELLAREVAAAEPSPQTRDLIGKKVSHYRILEVIGAGGMGLVYKAQDVKLGRAVALKGLPEEMANDQLALQRFEREAQTASALNHPNICTIHGIEEFEGQPFIAMELLEGESLAQRLLTSKPKAIPLAELLEIGIQICHGLEAAHEKGIIHRDIKPANIFLTKQGLVKILDFGIAKLVGEDATANEPETPAASSTLTRTGATAGTAGYMSPEQVRREKLDARTDLFSFGLILYEMAAGQHALTGATMAIVHEAILNETTVPAHQFNSGVPRQLDGVITKALEKDRERRYQSAAEMREDLARARKRVQPARRRLLTWTAVEADTAIQAEVQVSTAESSLAHTQPALQSPADEAVPKASRHWRKAAFVGAAALILLAANYMFWRPFRPITPPRSEKVMLAVLPFENLTGDPNKEYLADGLTEQTISQLGRLNPEQLGVIARTSVMGYKNKDERLDQIGRDLSVQYVLENSLRESGSHVRITAQLIQVKDQTHLWSQDYDYLAKDILNVQDDVAKAVAREIRLRLSSPQQADLARSRPINPEAFDAYMQGYYFFQRNTDKDSDMAAKYFERATQLDSSYALAWVGLSRVRNWQANAGVIQVEEGHRLAREAVERALALNPNLAKAHAQMGRIKQQLDFDWAGADASIQRAIALEPGDSEILRLAAGSAALLGRFDEALQLNRRAVDLDPLNADSWEQFAETEYLMGQLDQAAADGKKALELSPDVWLSHGLLSQIYITQGRPQDALPEIEQVRADFIRASLYPIAYYALGRKKESDAALSELITKYHAGGAYQIAEVYAFRNQSDEAFEWLERAYAQRDSGLIYTKVDPLLKSLHKDPRFTAFLKKLNLPT